MENKPNWIEILTLVVAAFGLVAAGIGTWVSYYDIKSRVNEIKISADTQASSQIALEKYREQKALCYEAVAITNILAQRLSNQSEEKIKYFDKNNFQAFMMSKKIMIENRELHSKLEEYDKALWHETNPDDKESEWFKTCGKEGSKGYKECDAKMYIKYEADLAKLSKGLMESCNKLTIP